MGDAQIQPDGKPGSRCDAHGTQKEVAASEAGGGSRLGRGHWGGREMVKAQARTGPAETHVPEVWLLRPNT